MHDDKLLFSIETESSYIKIIPELFTYPNSNNGWDSSWITSFLEIKAGAFSGRYKADFRNHDFITLKKELEYLYDHLESSARFDPLESYLNITFRGDGLGHIEVFCEASDNPGTAPTSIEFYMSIDQTYLQSLIRQLDSIVNEFPLNNRST